MHIVRAEVVQTMKTLCTIICLHVHNYSTHTHTKMCACGWQCNEAGSAFVFMLMWILPCLVFCSFATVTSALACITFATATPATVISKTVAVDMAAIANLMQIVHLPRSYAKNIC